jgi:hypothetical protein
VSDPLLSNGSIIAGSGATPGNSSDSDRGNAGNGGQGAGIAGRIIVIIDLSSITFGPTGANQFYTVP